MSKTIEQNSNLKRAISRANVKARKLGRKHGVIETTHMNLRVVDLEGIHTPDANYLIRKCGCTLVYSNHVTK